MAEALAIASAWLDRPLLLLSQATQQQNVAGAFLKNVRFVAGKAAQHVRTTDFALTRFAPPLRTQ